MRERPTPRFHPDLERLEAKQTLSAGASTAHVVHHLKARPPAQTAPPTVPKAADGGTIRASAVLPKSGFLVYRITNPSGFPPNSLKPPFGHVLVQASQPVPGQVYNILEIAVKNATNQTFDASSGFFVRLPHQRYFPILTGDEKWRPGQDFIFYALTKKYYPIANQVSGGFEFKLAGAWSVAVPGPSAIFLRVKYDPATIDKILNFAATQGPGAQGGAGIPTGLADTAIWAFDSVKSHRSDFGGYF